MRFDRPDANITWCPGCGNFMIIKALKAALEELDFTPQNTVLVSGIGQAAKTPQYIYANYFNGLHGRALPAATGIKISNTNLNVVVTSGDGDIYGEGGNHFLHAIRRNPNITVFVHNNMIYGLTKGQSSPTSSLKFVTKTQPLGNANLPINPIALSVAQGISFVGRAFCGDIEQTKELMKKAITHRGFSLLDIFQPCVTFNKINTYQWFKEHTYYLEDDYDPCNRILAFEKALEDEKMPLGVIFKNGHQTFEESDANRSRVQVPLFEHRVDLEKLSDFVHSNDFL